MSQSWKPLGYKTNGKEYFMFIRTHKQQICSLFLLIDLVLLSQQLNTHHYGAKWSPGIFSTRNRINFQSLNGLNMQHQQTKIPSQLNAWMLTFAISAERKGFLKHTLLICGIYARSQQLLMPLYLFFMIWENSLCRLFHHFFI